MMSTEKEDNMSRGKKAPRRCCNDGHHFFDALKAMVSRLLFMLHALVVVWRASAVMGDAYWGLSATCLGLIVETAVVLISRRGQEWKWFQPSVLLYLLCVVPPIWLMEMDCLGLLRETSNNGSRVCADDEELHVMESSVSLDGRAWLIILGESLLVMIIVARWLMPKGALTRDQLSSLLLAHLGTASDIVDFYSILSEDANTTDTFQFTVLALWSWSLLQFPFVVTATSVERADLDDVEDMEVDRDMTWATRQSLSTNITVKHKLSWERVRQYSKQYCRILIETEAWAILVSVLMQDGPFFLVRLVAIVCYNIFTYSNLFFLSKNALVLLLQLYRIGCLYFERQKEKAEEEQERKRAWKRMVFVNRVGPTDETM